MTRTKLAFGAAAIFTAATLSYGCAAKRPMRANYDYNYPAGSSSRADGPQQKIVTIDGGYLTGAAAAEGIGDSQAGAR